MKLFLTSNSERQPLLNQKQQLSIQKQHNILNILRISDLHDDVISEIFTYMTLRQLRVLSLVSKNFNRCVHDPLIWRHLILKNFPGLDAGSDIECYKKLYAQTKTNIKELHLSSLVELSKHIGSADVFHIRGLVLNDLLQKINGRPLIRLFSRNQNCLNSIYQSVTFRVFESYMHPWRKIFLALLCNQINLFIELFNKKKAVKYDLGNVEKLLLYACWLGYADLIEYIIHVRPDIDINKKHGESTCLELTVIESNHAAAKALLKAKASIKLDPTQKSWLLHGAARLGDARMFCLLIDYHADPDAIDATLESANDVLRKLKRSF